MRFARELRLLLKVSPFVIPLRPIVVKSALLSLGFPTRPPPLISLPVAVLIALALNMIALKVFSDGMLVPYMDTESPLFRQDESLS